MTYMAYMKKSLWTYIIHAFWWIFLFVFSQGPYAADSRQSDHHGENPKLLCDPGSTAAHLKHVSQNKADRSSAEPGHEGDLRLHTDPVEEARHPIFWGTSFQEQESRHRGHLLECHPHRHVHPPPGELAAVLPSITDPFCQRGAAHHGSGRRAGPRAGLSGAQTHHLGQALLLQPNKRLPVPEEAGKQQPAPLPGQVQGQDSRSDWPGSHWAA